MLAFLLRFLRSLRANHFLPSVPFRENFSNSPQPIPSFAAMPKYAGVLLISICYELAPVVVSSVELEERLTPLYARLRVQPGPAHSQWN